MFTDMANVPNLGTMVSLGDSTTIKRPEPLVIAEIRGLTLEDVRDAILRKAAELRLTNFGLEYQLGEVYDT